MKKIFTFIQRSYSIAFNAKASVVGLLFFFFSLQIFAQDKYIVQLANKNSSPFSFSNPSAYLSTRAIQRRTNQNIPIDSTDLPINPSYMSGIAGAGASILGHTKWMNAVIIQTSSSVVLNVISNLPYVVNVSNVGRHAGGNNIPYNKFKSELLRTDEMYRNNNANRTSSFNYGPSFNQIQMIGGDLMHDNGFTGTGIHIAVIDAGFENADNMDAFDSLFANNQILGTRDFVDNETNVYDNSSHGSMVLSIMGGNWPGNIVGTAPHAKFWLLRSEDAPTEYIIEEYNWAEAAEFADSVGADVINSSLGYTEFDDPAQNHTYNDMDGNTAPSTRAADFAAKKGMIVCNSAGNSGNGGWNFIGAPADADSILAIGAVNDMGIYASFSSNGPTSDGRVKPDVSAQGEGTWVADPSNFGVFPGNGTSFSSPVIAGMMACLWQCHPNSTNMQLIEAVKQSSSQFASPDTELGYGIPDFPQACLILGQINNNPSLNDFISFLGPNPFSQTSGFSFFSSTSQNIAVQIFDILGKLVYVKDVRAGAATYNKFSIPADLSSGMYVIKITSEKETFEKKILKL